MKYWSLSQLRHSPLMPAQHAWELANFYVRMPSEHAYDACLAVARQIEPVQMPGLVLIESVNVPMRLAYTEYPNIEEWLAVERVFVSSNDDGDLFLNMQPLH